MSDGWDRSDAFVKYVSLGVGTEQSTALELPLWSWSEFGVAESDLEQRQEFVKSARGIPRGEDCTLRIGRRT